MALNKINNSLDRLLSYKGISDETLRYKKTYWVAVLIVEFYVIGMTPLVFLLQIKGLMIYGYLLHGLYIPFLILFCFIHRKLEWMVHISQHTALLSTFFCIVKLGGIPHSGGIIFGALNAVIFSIIFYSVRWSTWYFILFVICTLLTFAIQSYYPVAPTMSTKDNNLIFLLNTLFLSGLTLTVVLVYLHQYTQIEKQEAIKQRELNDAKTRLYTNITHEFRTPLTVILGLADSLKTNSDEKTKADTIIKNGKNLLQLVEQILNLSKLESGKLQVNKVHGNIIPFLRYIFQLQQFYAEEKKLKMVFEAKAQSYELDFDPEKTTTIVSNILTNAIKFTPPGGEIGMNVRSLDNKLRIEIRDTGIGVSNEKQEKIFNRFYQADSKNTRVVGGTGIGLALTKELVELLHGTISLKSTPGIETIFTVELPITSFEKNLSQENLLFENKLPKELLQTHDNHEKPKLLIVEDNGDVISYLLSCYKTDYNIDIATDGCKGKELALKTIPDIIISDVMMPKMDGFELCKTLKEDFRTSHIPIILLTAKADIASRISGLEQGADAYIIKPFNQKELRIQMQNLLALRRNLFQHYSSELPFTKSSNPVVQREDMFYSKLTRLIRLKLHDEHFGVQNLCKEMAMSKSQLYRKFKALTNKSIAKYIRTLRLQKAKQFLQSSDMNITEIAYAVGMKSLSTFSQLFKEEFGKSPKTYIINYKANRYTKRMEE